MEFRTLGVKERRLLLTALKFDIKKITCQYCGDGIRDGIHFSKCGIMPPVKTKRLATILCESVMCMCQYLEDVDTAFSEKTFEEHKKDCPNCNSTNPEKKRK